MKENQSLDKTTTGIPENEDKQHVRSISTAPPATTVLPLKAVIEEDENSSRIQGVMKTPDGENKRSKDANSEAAKEDTTSARSVYDRPNRSRQRSGSVKTFSPSRPNTSANRIIHSAHKTISRGSSYKSRIAKKGSSSPKNVGQASDSDSDMEDMHMRDNRSDLDSTGVDINNEDDWDTDLENEEPSVTYDHSGRTTYIEACKKFGVVPASFFLRRMSDKSLSMRHHGLAGDGMKAVATSLVSNATINTLDLSDNWLGFHGGMALCEMLKENCFITDLNVSDNHLYLCAEQLSITIQQNNILRRVNISGNGFDDKCALPIADLIMKTTKLEYLNLSHNNLAEKAGLLLGPAISENICLRELDLSWNHLRRKGAMAVAAGIKGNGFMKRVNLSWNGFGLEGSLALMDALKNNNVLEELDIINNRITTEGAVLIGKGLSANENLKVFKIGKNPMQSAGCWGIAAAILKNPNCILEYVDFSDILVNRDFHDIWKQVQEQYPNLRHGGCEPPLKPKQQIHPMVKLTSYISSHKINLVDYFSRLDKAGITNVTQEAFRQGLALLIKETGLKLSDEEVEVILKEISVNENGEINYSELTGHPENLEQKLKTVGVNKQLRPMTS